MGPRYPDQDRPRYPLEPGGPSEETSSEQEEAEWPDRKAEEELSEEQKKAQAGTVDDPDTVDPYAHLKEREDAIGGLVESERAEEA